MGSKAIKFRNKNNDYIYPCPYFPVGSIYLSVSATNPSTYFGGTWEQIKDRFLIGAGNSYSVNSTGGNKTITIAQNNLPDRVMVRTNHNSGSACNNSTTVSSGYSNHCLHDAGLESGKAITILPPYMAVYMWRRTA